MPLNKLGAVSTMAREYPLGVFLGAFFGLGISRIHPNVEFVDTESMCNSNPPQFFCSFFFPEKDVSKAPHKYFSFPNQKNWLKNHVLLLDRCFFGDPGL